VSKLFCPEVSLRGLSVNYVARATAAAAFLFGSFMPVVFNSGLMNWGDVGRATTSSGMSDSRYLVNLKFGVCNMDLHISWNDILQAFFFVNSR
jgi:hypothetical protein